MTTRATSPTSGGTTQSRPDYDVVIIGGGSAGYAAARTAAELGARTVIIEGGEKIGGLCILAGCMPSKTFLESAHRRHAIQHAGAFGLEAKAEGVDMPMLQARKQRLITDFADHRIKQLTRGKFAFLRGNASFLDPHTLRVEHAGESMTVTGATFILSTGSVLQRVAVPGLWETGCWTSDTALETEVIPPRLAVLGGGIVAVELGQFFSRMGSETTLLQRSDRVLRDYDHDVSEELERAFAAEKLKVVTGVQLIEVKQEGREKKIVYRHGEKQVELVVDEILYAMGRLPNLQGLGLEKAGVEIEKCSLVLDPTLRTTAPHIFAAGDVAGPHEVVHIAIQQGECVARNAVESLRGAGRGIETIDYRLKTLVTFTDPEIALVGLTEAEAAKQGIDYLVGKYPFDELGKAMIGGHSFGFVKLLSEKKRGEIIGAQIVGPHASDLIHELIAVMYFRGTVRDLVKMPHYHPTLSEIISYPAEEMAMEIGGRVEIENLETTALVD